jgi:hypothetical protein
VGRADHFPHLPIARDHHAHQGDYLSFALSNRLSSPAGYSMPPEAGFATFIFPGEQAMPVLLTLLFPGGANRAGQGVPIGSASSWSHQSAGP